MKGPGDESQRAARDEAAATPAPARHAVSDLLAGRRAIVDEAKAWLDRNRRRIALLGPAGLYLVIVGGLLFHAAGITMGLLLTAVIGVLGPRVPADTMLSLYRAEPVAPGQAEGLRAAMTTLSGRAGLTNEPALAIIPSLAVGAFSVGHAPRTALLMTEGLLRRMSLRELVAIAAHEIAHIHNGDLPVFALADTLVRVAQVLFYLGVFLLSANLLAWLAGEPGIAWLPVALLLCAPMLNAQLQLALPRDRDLEADRLAAMMLGDTHAVTAAASLLGDGHGSILDDFRLPVPQRRCPLPSPLRCHADAAARIAALAGHPPAALLPPLTVPDEPMISLLGFGPVEMRPRNRWPGLWF